MSNPGERAAMALEHAVDEILEGHERPAPEPLAHVRNLEHGPVRRDAARKAERTARTLAGSARVLEGGPNGARARRYALASAEEAAGLARVEPDVAEQDGARWWQWDGTEAMRRALVRACGVDGHVGLRNGTRTTLRSAGGLVAVEEGDWLRQAYPNGPYTRRTRCGATQGAAQK